jgi:hypothetical protein
MTSEERFEATYNRVFAGCAVDTKQINNCELLWQAQDRYYEARIKELEAKLNIQPIPAEHTSPMMTR